MTKMVLRNTLLLVIGAVTLSRAQEILPIPLKSALRFGLDFVIVSGDSPQSPRVGEDRQKKQSFFRSEGGLKFTKIDQSMKIIPDINIPYSYLGLKEQPDPENVTQEEYEGLECLSK